jgi:TetR/AcrR family transcriptional repressor of nem operon
MGNREKLLDTAAALFARVGYHGTSVDAILGAAEVAPSNFYYHFRSKEELALNVLEGYIDKSRQWMAPVFRNGHLTATQKLERFHQQFVKVMVESGCCGGSPLGNLAQELSDSRPVFRKRLAGFFEECIQGIAAVVQEGIRSGEFPAQLDPEAAAFLLFGSIEGLLLLTKSIKKTDPLEKGFRLALKMLSAQGRSSRSEAAEGFPRGSLPP